MTSRRIAVSVLFALVLGLPLSAQAEQLIVVEARGIALAQGASVDSDKALSLKEGQHVTLISPAGVTLQLDGPFNGKPSAKAQGGMSLSSKLAALGAGQQRFSEVGTTRSTADVKLPSPWLLDVVHSGSVCLRDGGGEPVLWRPAPSAASDIVVTPDDRSWRATVPWPAGRDTLTLTDEVPIHAGATYYVTVAGERHAISVYDVPASLSTAQMRAAWLAQKGCEAQARALLRTVQ